MKLLITADIHGRKKSLDAIKEKAKSEKPDFIISAGDLSVFERDLPQILFALDKIGIPVIIIPGNHESPEDLEELSERYNNIIYLHSMSYVINGYIFLAYGNPGFALVEPGMEKFLSKAKKDMKGKKAILITHGPPFGTKLDNLYGEHVGCKTITKFIKENDDVVLAVSGHLHENFGVKDKIGKTKLINPGPNGEMVEI